jgi:hypothetical protein
MWPHEAVPQPERGRGRRDDDGGRARRVSSPVTVTTGPGAAGAGPRGGRRARGRPRSGRWGRARCGFISSFFSRSFFTLYLYIKIKINKIYLYCCVFFLPSSSSCASALCAPRIRKILTHIVVCQRSRVSCEVENGKAPCPARARRGAPDSSLDVRNGPHTQRALRGNIYTASGLLLFSKLEGQSIALSISKKSCAARRSGDGGDRCADLLKRRHEGKTGRDQAERDNRRPALDRFRIPRHAKHRCPLPSLHAAAFGTSHFTYGCGENQGRRRAAPVPMPAPMAARRPPRNSICPEAARRSLALYSHCFSKLGTM